MKLFQLITQWDFLGTDPFFLRLSNRKTMTAANATIAIWCEGIKITSTCFCQISKKILFGEPPEFSS